MSNEEELLKLKELRKPKKPLLKTNEFGQTLYICPNCESYVRPKGYCITCGQNIDCSE